MGWLSRFDRPPSRAQIRLIGSSLQLTEGPFEDLSWLPRLAQRLRTLLLTSMLGDLDLDVINQLTELRSLRMWAYRPKGVLVLQRLPKLTDLAVGPRVKVDWDGGGGALRTVMVTSPRRADIEAIQDLPVLEDLALVKCSSLPDRFAGPIKELSISCARWSSGHTFAGVESLTKVELTSVRGISDLGAFGAARSLRTVWIEDCPDLTSLEGAVIARDANVLLVGDTPVRKLWKA